MSPSGAHGTLYDVRHEEAACWSQVHATKFKGIKESYMRVINDGSLEIHTSAFTWTAWVQPLTSGEGPLFIFQDNTKPNELGVHIWFINDGLYVKLVDNTAGPQLPVTSTPENVLTIGYWNKVGVRYEGMSGTVSTIINGHVTSESRANLTDLNVSSWGDLYMGSR